MVSIHWPGIPGLSHTAVFTQRGASVWVKLETFEGRLLDPSREVEAYLDQILPMLCGPRYGFKWGGLYNAQFLPKDVALFRQLSTMILRHRNTAALLKSPTQMEVSA
jgi:hypothetical protein